MFALQNISFNPNTHKGKKKPHAKKKKKKPQKNATRLITETEEAECFACKIVPMTSAYGQGNFSVKLREQEMKRVQRLKHLQQL